MAKGGWWADAKYSSCCRWCIYALLPSQIARSSRRLGRTTAHYSYRIMGLVLLSIYLSGTSNPAAPATMLLRHTGSSISITPLSVSECVNDPIGKLLIKSRFYRPSLGHRWHPPVMPQTCFEKWTSAQPWEKFWTNNKVPGQQHVDCCGGNCTIIQVNQSNDIVSVALFNPIDIIDIKSKHQEVHEASSAKFSSARSQPLILRSKMPWRNFNQKCMKRARRWITDEFQKNNQ